MHLRDYQASIIGGVRSAWGSGARNVCVQLATGGGKTFIFAQMLREHDGAACAIAHRRELVGQMSTTLARLDVRHRIIAPLAAIKEIVTLHLRATGRSYHDPHARIGVAGVDTLGRRDLAAWEQQVTLWVCDETHHLLAKNKWGKALALFPNARGLGVTATPLRADGKGLGRHADGLLDALIVGPDMRTLIDRGFLTDYRIFAPQSDIDLAAVPVSDATGDYSPPALREAAKRSHITGDLVDTYCRLAPGKLGVTFTVSVDLAAETAARYREAGVASEYVSADTPGLARAEILRRFARREIMQLVNVDLFGEGFDLPALEVVSMGRPTQSYGLYCQQFGRSLRPMEGKQAALIIDHVGNVLRHGLPDAPRVWSLDRRERRKANATGPTVKVCPACAGVFERALRECPYCGHVPEPVLRVAPAHVDGDLLELDPRVLARLRGEAARIGDAPLIPRGASSEVRRAIMKRHRALQTAQRRLRDRIAWWAGWQRALGRDDGEGYRRFYLGFGVDVATAQTLRTQEANELADRVDAALVAAGVAAGLPGVAA